MGCSKTNLLGEFPRSPMRPLYRKFYARSYVASLSAADRSLFQRWVGLLKSIQHRVHRCNLAKPDPVVYTDASLRPRRIAGLVMTSSTDEPAICLLAEAVAPNSWVPKFNKNPIIGREILAPLALIETESKIPQWRRVNIYADNDASENALIRGFCHDPGLASMIRTFWEKLNNSAWMFGLVAWGPPLTRKISPQDIRIFLSKFRNEFNLTPYYG